MATLKQNTRKGLKKAATVTKRTVTRLSKKVRTALGSDVKATKRTRRTRRRSTARKVTA